jgi:hypothetical protein
MGIKPEMVELLASLALGKRLEKVTKVLRKTCSYLKSDLRESAIAFASQHPPLRPDSFFNACQFYSFLRHRWLACPPDPPFLPDLAYCELAVIAVERRARAGAMPRLPSAKIDERLKVRRHPALHFRRCQYDIRRLLDGTEDHEKAIQNQSICLVLSQPLGETVPKIFHADETLFALLRGWNLWSVHPASELMQRRSVFEFWQKLESLGFIEVTLCESP